MTDKANKLTPFARELRKNQTKEEALLWYHFLRKCQPRFHRQYVIGRYIVDFYCHKAKIVVELDGSQHYENDGIKKDIERDAYLRSQGMTILRYSNADINLRFRDVCQDIWRHLLIEE